jgi:hypothetical protein
VGSETEWGFAAGDPNATNVVVSDVRGFVIKHGSTKKLHADISGNLHLEGDLSIGAAGVFRSVATDFSTGTGLFMDYNGGTPRLRIGNPAGNRLQWNGSQLLINGHLEAATGTFSGALSAATGTFAGALSAATGTFAGALSAASGTFAGSLSGASGSFVPGTVTIDASGIVITPSTIFAPDRSYRFGVATGDLGTFGAEGGSGGRTLSLRSTWTGVGNYASGPGVSAGLNATHQPSSGGTFKNAFVVATASGSSSFVSIASDLLDVTGPAAISGALTVGTTLAVTGTTALTGQVTFSAAPRFDGPNQTTVGAAGAAAALPSNPAGYIVINNGGTEYLVPAYLKP